MFRKNLDGDRNNSRLTMDKNVSKRSYNKKTDKLSASEPLKKVFKFDKNYELDKENQDFINYNRETETDFVKIFVPPIIMYKSLFEKENLNDVILRRCLTYNNGVKNDIQKLTVESIADNIQKLNLTDKNMTLLKAKALNSDKYSVPLKIVIKFDQFLDNESVKDWETVEAEVCVDIVHWYRDSRKNKDSFSGSRIINRYKVSCNHSIRKIQPEHIVEISTIAPNDSTKRMYKSMFHFKILAKEKKIYAKNISDDKPPEHIYPVTYEAMMPVFGSNSDARVNYGRYLIQPGVYEIFPYVTNLERCDDSMFSKEQEDTITADGDKRGILDCRWTKSTYVMASKERKNNARLLFTVRNNEAPRQSTVTFNKAGRSHHPLTELSANKNAESPDLSLVSVKIQETPKMNIKIVFRFFIGKNVVQWAKSKDLTCPWCKSHFKVISDVYTTVTNMLTHLNLMHPKFAFRCLQLSNLAAALNNEPVKSITIDVTLSELSPAVLDFGLRLSGTFPMKRMPLSEVIHVKTKGCIPQNSDYIDEKRYCQSWSSSINRYSEFDVNSESEDNMSWLFDYYFKKVERLSEPNHAEKLVLQLWNRSLLEYGFWIRDSEMRTFVEYFVQDLIDNEQKLRDVSRVRNTLLMHLMNLVDYGLLTASVVLACMKRLDEAIGGLPGCTDDNGPPARS